MPLTENEVRYQNAALADENARLLAALAEAYEYLDGIGDYPKRIDLQQTGDTK